MYHQCALFIQIVRVKTIEKSLFVIYCYVSLSLPKSLPHILLLREIKRNPNDSNNIGLFEFCAKKGKQNKVYIMFLQKQLRKEKNRFILFQAFKGTVPKNEYKKLGNILLCRFIFEKSYFYARPAKLIFSAKIASFHAGHDRLIS